MAAAINTWCLSRRLSGVRRGLRLELKLHSGRGVRLQMRTSTHRHHIYAVNTHVLPTFRQKKTKDCRILPKGQNATFSPKNQVFAFII